MQWQKVKSHLKDWRHWNWRRIGLNIAVFSPLGLIVLLSFHLGLTFFLVGFLEVTEIAPNIEINDKASSLQVLEIINDGTIMMGISLVMIQTAILTLFYSYPKADAWVKKVTRRRQEK